MKNILLFLACLAASIGCQAQTYVSLAGINRSNSGPFIGNYQFSQKWTGVPDPINLQLPSTLFLEQDAYSGGFNSGAHKTQWQPLRIEMFARTIGERKGTETNVWSYGKGDNIGIMASTYDWGGYSTGGDEGSEGARFQSFQGDGTATAGVPSGTVASVAANAIEGTWSSGTNANLGEQRPLINTSRAVYSTGTISSVSGSPCVAVGSGTSWTTLGAGAHSDLFLNVTANDNGSIKHVVPITNVTDDTHVTLEYKLAELGAGCFGVSLQASGSYNIYKGGTVASLGTAGGDGNATGVNLASGGSNFQVGDSIQEPVGYNYHGRGVAVILNRYVGENQGGGFYVNNLTTPCCKPYRDAFRATGAFDNGLLFDSTNTSLLTNGVKFDTPVVGPLLSTNNTDAIGYPAQIMLQALNQGGAARQLTYFKASDHDYWQWGGGQYFSATDARIGLGTTPQLGVRAYVYWNDATSNGITVAPAVAANAGKYYFSIEKAGAPQFRVYELKTNLALGSVFNMYSDSETTLKATFSGVTGEAQFAGNVRAGLIGTGNAAIDAYGTSTGQNTIIATPLAGAGGYVIRSNDSGGNPQLGITTTGELDHPQEADFVIQNLATTHAVNIKTNGLVILYGTSAGIAQFPNGAQVNTLSPASKPTCDSNHRFVYWSTAGAGGVKDNVEVCAKDAADVYAWRTIY